MNTVAVRIAVCVDKEGGVGSCAVFGLISDEEALARARSRLSIVPIAEGILVARVPWGDAQVIEAVAEGES